jgi:zinc/manganese transport system substrate-binding protein
VVANGLGLEEGLADTLDRARSGGVEVFEVAPELDPLPAGEGDEHAGDEDHAGDDEHADDGGHDHGDLDPHVWMDPVRMADAAELIGARLADVEGLGVPPARLERCTADYAQRLRGVAEEAAATLAAVPAERRKLVTDHESLAYFADRFDLEVVGAAIPSTSSLGEPNARDLEDLAEVVRATGVPAVFASVDGSDDVAQALADRVGGDVAVVSLHLESLDEPGAPAGTYEGMVRTNAALVADALAGRRG